MLQTGMVKIAGTDVQLWVGQKVEGKKGPVFFYWHGTGGSSSEASRMSVAIREIMAEGGIMASFNQTTKKGMNTGNNVWYTGDFEMADHILACAVEQGLSIDMRRIYTGGCSAGGLQAGAMVYGRSSYLAAAMPNSGGTVFPSTLQDPMHVPALITTHGKMGTDVVGIDFSTTSLSECRDIAKKGGFAVDCDHGGRHCGATAEVTNAQWEFLKQHPFGVSPEPYANGLPPSFPQYCTIIK